MKTVTTQVPALDKIVRICDYLSDKDGATFSQIYQGVGMAKSSTSSLLSSMVAHGLLRQENDKYFLGLRLYEFGNKAVEQYDIKKIALPVLAALRDKTNLTCHLGVLEGSSPIYLLKLESPQSIIVRSWEGKRLSLHSSGLGKALLAWKDEREVDALLSDDIPLVRHTPNTITDRNALKQELAISKARGWAWDNEEDCPGVRCIAAPVFNRQNQVVAAISMSGVVFQISDDQKDRFVALVCDAARQLSSQLD